MSIDEKEAFRKMLVGTKRDKVKEQIVAARAIVQKDTSRRRWLTLKRIAVEMGNDMEGALRYARSCAKPNLGHLLPDDPNGSSLSSSDLCAPIPLPVPVPIPLPVPVSVPVSVLAPAPSSVPIPVSISVPAPALVRVLVSARFPFRSRSWSRSLFCSRSSSSSASRS